MCLSFAFYYITLYSANILKNSPNVHATASSIEQGHRKGIILLVKKRTERNSLLAIIDIFLNFILIIRSV